MRLPRTLRHVVTGLLLGAILIGAAAPARAQWAVYDHPNWVLKFREIVAEANRWVETANHYADMYQKTADQLLTLGGILDKVDETLSRNKDIVVTFSNLGKAVRDSRRLWRQVQNMVHCRIQTIENMGRRLKNGVFDMDANMHDLETYVTSVIGKRAEDTIANIERAANGDPELERLRFRLYEIESQLAEQEENLKQYEKMLEMWEGKPEDKRFGIEHVNTQIALCKQTIAQLEKDRDEVLAKIVEHMKKFGLTLEQRGNFAQQVRESEEAIRSITAAKEEILDAIEKEFMTDGIVADDDLID